MVIQYETDKRRKIIKDVITKDDLLSSFQRLGLKKGMIVYVQSNLSSLAYVNGKEQAIIEALQETIGYEGTLVLSSFTTYLMDPSCSREYRFERDIYDEIRNTMPCFHKKKMPSEDSLANQLMMNDAVYRSNHPTHSCVAWGKYAKLICDKHPLHFSLGKDSFLAKISEMNGYVLLLGVPYHECDIFKYASCICEKKPIKIVRSPIEKKNGKEFISMLEMEYSKRGIQEIQNMMEERNVVRECFIDQAYTRFFKAKEATMLAQAYFNSFE